MSISYEDAKDLHSVLEQKHARRHSDLRALRRYWQGDYWESGDGDRSMVSSVSQLFRDLKGQNADVGPDLKLVHNILQEVCVKYQTFLCPVPMTKTFVDTPFSDKRRAQATKKQRAIQGTWWANRMAMQMANVAWYLPLMGDCFPGIWPDFERKIPRFVLRSPEIAYPVPSWDGTSLEEIIFCWEMDERQVMREYPSYTPRSAGRGGKFRLGFKKANAGGQRKVQVIEYSGQNECSMWADDQTLRSINHGFGFNLFDQMSFIPVPGEDFNHGAVEQIVSLVEMGNALHSLLFQATLENVFPMMVIEDPAKAPEEIMRGAGAVVPVNAGGKVYYESPPVQALPMQMAFLRDNADKILEASGMPRVNFGQSPTTSIATGSAINELQGAGTGSTVEMVQGTGIGPALEAWNEKALFMYQNVFRDDTIQLYGTEQRSVADLAGRQFALTFKGSEIVGSTRNKVVFSPHMDDHEKLVMGLQGLGGGIFSKAYVREQLGISDNDEMLEQIAAEMLEDGVMQAIVMKLQQDPSPQNEEKLLTEVTSFIEQVPVPVQPHPLLAAAAASAAPGGPGPTPTGAGAPGGMPIGQLPGAPGQFETPALPLPPGSPTPDQAAAPAGPPPAPVGPTGGGVQLDAAVAAFAGVPLHGRAWLAGEIVQAGSTQDTVDIFITDKNDQPALQSAAQFPVSFHVTPDEPQEQAVEIGASAQPQQ